MTELRNINGDILTEVPIAHVFLEHVWGVNEPDTDIASHLRSAGIDAGSCMWIKDEVDKAKQIVRFRLYLTAADMRRWRKHTSR